MYRKIYSHANSIRVLMMMMMMIVTSSSLVRSRERSFLDKIRYFILASVAESVR